jgi:hypothetical protein
MYTTVGTYSFSMTVVLVGLEPMQPADSHLKRIKSNNCCIHTVVPPDDGPRYARHTYRLTKYIKKKSYIKLLFLYTIQGLVNALYVQVN